MTRIVINGRRYVIIPEREYIALEKRGSLKTPPYKKQSLAAGRKHALKLIDQFSKMK
jgi:hypothetical protein